MRNQIKLAAIALAMLASTGAGAQENPGGSAWGAKKSSWLTLQPGQREEAFHFTEKYRDYLATARTAQTSTSEAIRMAKAAGFVELTKPEQVKPGARLIMPARERALVLAVIGQQAITNGSHLIGTHHDSPHIDLKARPVIGAAQNSLALFKTVYYAGRPHDPRIYWPRSA
jgi:aspartyl aminopeptidase